MLNSSLRALVRSLRDASIDEDFESLFDAVDLKSAQPLFYRPPAPATQTVFGQPPNWTPFNGKGATPAQVRLALAANNLTVTGAGIKVGVISNNFNGNGYAAGNLGYGTLLPTQANVKVLSDFAQQGTDDEGRAMMQVVHDVAPGSQLEFCTNSGTLADFQNNIAGSDTAMAHAILALAADGCRVICDDIVMQDAPMFQSGVVAQAIKTVEAQGVIYLSCAGNQNSSPTQGYSGSTVTDPAYQSAWTGTDVFLYTPTTGYLHYTDALSFNGSPFQALTLAPGAECHLELQWAQPWGHATTNLALAVSYADGSGGGILLEGLGGNYYFWTNANNPLTPGESVNLKTSPLVDQFYGPSDTTTLINQSNGYETVYISVINLGGPNPSLIKEIAYTNGGAPGGVVLAGANTGAVQGWHESPDQITVGAADAGNTPGLGSAAPLAEYFSASGYNEQWFFDANGNPLATPQNLFPVAITGVDDIDTSDVVNGHNYAGISDFFGTSCATPSVAGVAALVLQRNGNLNTSDVRNLMEDSAIPMAIGEISGAGLVQANKAVAYAGGLITVDTSHAQWLGTHLADVFAFATEALLASRATYGFGGSDTARIGAHVTVKDADFVNLHNITTLQLAGGDTATVGAKAIAAGLRTINNVNTGGRLNTVNASNFSVRLNAAQVSVVGGGDAIAIVGSGSTLSLSGTANVFDTVISTQNTINLTNAQANIVGGGNIVAFVGATGNVVTLSGTNGATDTVSGSGGKVTLRAAQAAFAGGGYTIVANAGSSLSVSQTGTLTDVVTATNAVINVNAAQARISGGGNTVHVNGASTLTLANTGVSGDTVTAATARVTLAHATVTLTGSGDTFHFAGTNTLNVSGNSQNFYFAQTIGLDRISGFNATDKLHLSAADWSSYAALKSSGDMKQSGANVTIGTDAANTITLANVQLAALTQSQFVFA